MTDKEMLSPDYLFEVSWEVCNKVGGIYTVISTKALTLVNKFEDNYILIGPDVWKETGDNPEFTEDKFLYRSWCLKAESEGLKFRIGRWNIQGNPVAILVDFTTYFQQKDKVFSSLWETYRLDSINGQWDYIEPALFGFAAGNIIKSFYDYFLSSHDKIVAQFHEWMTGTGVLFLKEKAPQVGTVFTTHATVLGRSVAGNAMPLYGNIAEYQADFLARNMGVESKFSLEKLSAAHCDSFTTVSEITDVECTHFLDKKVDIVTPNGFENAFVPSAETYQTVRNNSRNIIRQVSEALLNQKLPENTVFILNSGRYEFRNKGIDLYIEALGQLNKNKNLDHEIVAFIAVPAQNYGPSVQLQQRMEEKKFDQAVTKDYCTHYLANYDTDLMVVKIIQNDLYNLPFDKVKIVIVPTYLDGNDGIFNLKYYDFLIGFDLTVFPSYYEPWGYTPLESIAFKIPTITTNLAGFGKWVLQSEPGAEDYATVLNRTDNNEDEVVKNIADQILKFINYDAEKRALLSENAAELSSKALWENLCMHYFQAYDVALQKSLIRYDMYQDKSQSMLQHTKPIDLQEPVWKKVLIKPSIPEKLSPLYKLSRNLWWSWNYDAIDLFESISPALWEKCHQNPIALLESLTYEDFRSLEKNENFLSKMNDVFLQFQKYLCGGAEKSKSLVAYFSMEFGLHHSLKIYSGGLGILAGDFLKEASDTNANIVGVGLLYRYGYFDQSISLFGNQVNTYSAQKFSHLPLIPVRSKEASDSDTNNWLKIQIAAPGRTITAKIWRVDIGRTSLYLLDTDIDENLPEDRIISHNLYGGDNELRFKQELLLGVGGIRCLDQLGIKPDIFHCNEGHAAFIGIERLRKYVQDENLSFYEAVEVVKASALFTTHTPVPAGHDTFNETTLRTYIPHYADRFRISWETFMGLGRVNEKDQFEKFSMSVLASRLSAETNGVSRIHGNVTRKMFANLYPGYYPEELHIGYVTNGVHFPTWVSKKWKKLYDEIFDPEYINNQSEKHYWEKIHDVDDGLIWEMRQKHREELVEYLKKRLEKEMTIRQDNPQNIFKISEAFNPKALTIGFARRFATYKRAHLLFSNLQRLSKIVNDPNKPVQFVYAGKAHPSDGAGQSLIKKIYDISNMPEFVGKIMIVENYDMELGKRLVQGVDIWLNTPTRPQEASGTSGEKAIMNGVLNFSVLDGWWAEGYRSDAGWSLKEERTYQNQDAQDALDAATIYNLLENEIAPLFYKRNKAGIPVEWVQKIKNTIAYIAPDFTMKRMLQDYIGKYYNPIAAHSAKINENNYNNARKLASWKQKMIRSWDSLEVISVKTAGTNQKAMSLGEKFFAEIKLKINEVNENDLGIELLIGQKINETVETIMYKHQMEIVASENDVVTFYFEKLTENVGVYDFAFRVYPKNCLLAHRQDFPLMKWL